MCKRKIGKNKEFSSALNRNTHIKWNENSSIKWNLCEAFHRKLIKRRHESHERSKQFLHRFSASFHFVFCVYTYIFYMMTSIANWIIKWTGEEEEGDLNKGLCLHEEIYLNENTFQWNSVTHLCALDGAFKR